jgi:D-amino-acid dehydrogenase
LKIVVLGAGVIGITTAYYLAREGHSVTVLDELEEAAMGTTYANGGQISVSHPESWAAPEVPRMLLRSLHHADGPLQVRLSGDPAMWAWGLRFLRNCTTRRRRRNTAAIARLALYSQGQLRKLCEETDIDFAHHVSGTLHLFTEPGELEQASRLAQARRQFGIAQQHLDRDACLAIEPALAAGAARLCGGIYAPADESGDAFLFTQDLARVCAGQDVAFLYATRVEGFEQDNQRIRAVMTTRGRVSADCVIIALGVGSTALVRSLGMRAPIYPVKGYSATLPVSDRDSAPHVNIIYETRRIVISRLGERIRIAGGADVTGYDRELDIRRAQAVLSPAFTLFPQLGGGEQAVYWTGLRPMTPDGPPLLGSTPYRNLFLNTGHGSLGWTLACGSARAVADLISGTRPAIDIQDYALARFA